MTILDGDISWLGCLREQGGRALCAEEKESLSEISGSVACASVVAVSGIIAGAAGVAVGGVGAGISAGIGVGTAGVAAVSLG